MATCLLVLCGLWASGTAHAQTSTPLDPAHLGTFFDAFMDRHLAENHIAGATVAVVQDGQLVFTRGYGYADLADQTPVDPATTLFRVGSITKLFTWTEAMQLYEQGRLDLQADVNRYLPSFQIPDTYPGRPITFLHLMSHTPGFEDRGFEIESPSPEEMPTLETWLSTHLPARVRPPGEIAAYSNYGTALAGYIVTQIAGLPYDDYLETHILNPLEMHNTTSRQPLPDNLAMQMTKGYQFIDGTHQVEEFELLNVAPAGSISATAEDMAHFMIAHLQNGRYADTQILQEATAQQMHSQIFTHDERLNGFAYGFFEMDRYGLRMIGHGGDTRIFSSLLVLWPEEKLGLFFSFNAAIPPPLRETLLVEFTRQFLGPAGASTPAATMPLDNMDRFTGSYPLSRSSFTTVEKVARLFLRIFQIQAGEDGTLLVNSAYNGPQQFVAVEPLVFQEADGPDLLIFQEDSESHITGAFINSLPSEVLERAPWYESATFHLALLLSSLVVLTSYLIAGVARFLLGRRSISAQDDDAKSTRVANWSLYLVTIFAFVFVLGFVAVLIDIKSFMLGQIFVLRLVLLLPLLIIILTLVALFYALRFWWRGEGQIGPRIHYSLTTLAAIALVWVLGYWNLLGWRF